MTEKLREYLINFDQFIQIKIQLFKKNPLWNQILDFYSGLNEEAQKYFKWGLYFALYLIPFFIVSIFWLSTHQLNKNVQNRTELVNIIQTIISQNADINSLSTGVVSPNSYTDQSQLSSKFSSMLQSQGIDTSKIQVAQFESTALSTTLSQIDVDFKFDSLTTDQLVSMLINLMSFERMKISSLSVNRNNDQNRLEGEFHGILLSRSEELFEGNE